MKRPVVFHDLGSMDYKACWDLQEVHFNRTVQTKFDNRAKAPEEQVVTTDHLFFVEHPHVYTLGKSGDMANLLLDDEALTKVDARFYAINRGGDITYHGPGQIVGYPIFDLDHHFTDIHKYLRLLEESVIQMLAHYGIKGVRYDGYTGVWLEPDKPAARKICAMGVRCSRWVTMHGFALNVNTNLSYFKHIVPCGIDDKDVTSMERELGYALNFEEVSQVLKEKIAEQFNFTYL